MDPVKKTAFLPLDSEQCAQRSMSQTCVLMGRVSSVLRSSRAHAQQQQQQLQQLQQGPLRTTAEWDGRLRCPQAELRLLMDSERILLSGCLHLTEVERGGS
ncbi:Hypothetical predicted protein [Scomber scombrus]|uniref:Uncharacterized protein n=1 Tax=Scomber scombrus TaxID=13677 RepID=A0AAV1NHG1_SCOSC